MCQNKLVEQKHTLKCCKNVVCKKCLIPYLDDNILCPVCEKFIYPGKVKQSVFDDQSNA